MNYDEDVEIDENVLDVECLEQAALMMKYCRHAAKCEREKDILKSKLDLIESELDNDIRQFPAKYKIEKITDKVVEKTIPLQKEYQKAVVEYLDAKFEWGVAKGAIDAFQDRRAMLESLVKLHGQQYFAGPKIPHNLSEQRVSKEKERERSNQIQSGVASKMKRSR
jgi:hypothetical protein